MSSRARRAGSVTPAWIAVLRFCRKARRKTSKRSPPSKRRFAIWIISPRHGRRKAAAFWALSEQPVVLAVLGVVRRGRARAHGRGRVCRGYGTTSRCSKSSQAALYAWIESVGDDWHDDVLGPGDVVLIVDVGGGTTDFSAPSQSWRRAARPELRRVAVGDHLLLGGDNMDLALAHGIRARLEADGKELDTWQSPRAHASPAERRKNAFSRRR